MLFFWCIERFLSFVKKQCSHLLLNITCTFPKVTHLIFFTASGYQGKPKTSNCLTLAINLITREWSIRVTSTPNCHHLHHPVKTKTCNRIEMNGPGSHSWLLEEVRSSGFFFTFRVAFSRWNRTWETKTNRSGEQSK